jgi:tRNA threonylcarbamoyladenosine biosynthesis protein TsaB
MPEQEAKGLSVAFDTASDFAGVALTQDGELLSESSWRTRQNHSRELLPALDWLLSRQGRSKHEIGAVFVCLGPGSYAGLRVGVSTAKALAYGLNASIAGVGRLAADAEPFVGGARGRVVPIHAAGRAELAWAAYEGDVERMDEDIEPRLGSADELLAILRPEDLVCADLKTLAGDLLEKLRERGIAPVQTLGPRVAAVARLGWRLFEADSFDNPDTLVPLYLRAPAIGPQR